VFLVRWGLIMVWRKEHLRGCDAYSYYGNANLILVLLVSVHYRCEGWVLVLRVDAMF